MKRLLHKRQPFSSKGATVAQLVAQRIRNAWVAGSSPAVGSIEFAGQSPMRLAFLFLLTRIALPKKREYGADIISSASKYRQKVAKRRAFCSEKTAPVLYPLFLRGSAFGGLRFLLFLLLDFDTVGKNQNRHAWFSII